MLLQSDLNKAPAHMTQFRRAWRAEAAFDKFERTRFDSKAAHTTDLSFLWKGRQKHTKCVGILFVVCVGVSTQRARFPCLPQTQKTCKSATLDRFRSK